MHATLATLIPLAVVLAVMIASYIDRTVERNRLISRLDAEEQHSGENSRPRTPTTNLPKQASPLFQNLLDNLIGLRQRQPAAFPTPARPRPTLAAR